MPPPALAWYDSTDTTVQTTFSLAVVPGVPSAPVEYHLWNAKGGVADTARNLRLLIAVRNPGDLDFLSVGRPAVDQRWVQAQIIGAQGAAVAVTTGWLALGAGASLQLPDLPQNSAFNLQFRVVTPAGYAGPPALEFDLQIDSSLSQAMGEGHASDPDGVFSGIGDQRFTVLVLGGAVTASSPTAATVELAYLAWIAAGLPLALAASQMALNANDGNAVAIGAGEEYTALLAAAADGTVHATKSPKAATGASVRPILPAGQVVLAAVVRDGSAVIDTSKITDLRQPQRYPFSASGLLATIGPGSGRVDNFLTRSSSPQNVALTDASTNWLWLQGDGSIGKTTTSASPVPGASLLWEADTAGGVVTAARDRRIFIGPALRRLRVRFGVPLAAANLSDQEVNAEARTVYLDPERPLTLSLDDLGAGLTAGASRIDLQISAAGGAWASIYPDQASMPQIAWNATNPATGASRPTVLAIPAGARLRARVDGIPTGTTPPGGATVVVGGQLR